MEEREAAVFYQGEGYSILIPEDNWEYDSGFVGDKEADFWRYLPGDGITLCVISLKDMKKEFAAEWVIRQYGAYHFEIDGTEELKLSGTDADGQSVLEVTIFQQESTYAVVSSYPLEAAEGAGIRMEKMVDSLVFEEVEKNS